MKRTTFALFLALVLVSFTSGFAQVTSIEGVEVIKGKLVDNDYDGYYDHLDLKVVTKFGEIYVPISSACIVRQDGSIVYDLPFCNSKLKKRVNVYQFDLVGKEVSGDFNLLIKFDTSGVTGLEDDGSGIIIDAGPVGKPNETILIIKYP